MCADPGPRYRLLNLALGEAPRSVTLSVAGATYPPAAELRGLTIIFPVESPPSVKVCVLVVARFPVPVRYAALLPEFAEIEAVGVPVFIFKTPNFAEVEAVPPTRRSTVAFPVN